MLLSGELQPQEEDQGFFYYKIRPILFTPYIYYNRHSRDGVKAVPVISAMEKDPEHTLS